MSAPLCESPLSLSDLAAYRVGELDVDQAERLEEHFFACASCARRLDMIERLQAGIAGAVREGRVSSSVTGEMVAHLAALGVRLRTYRVAPGEEVACTVAPDDDFVVIRMPVDVVAGDSVDIEAEVTDLRSGDRRRQVTPDVAIDQARGEIVFAYAGDLIRTVPRSRWTMRVRVLGPLGERVQGPYILDHTPWEERGT